MFKTQVGNLQHFKNQMGDLLLSLVTETMRWVMILHYVLVSITTSVASQSLMLMLWSKHNFWASLDPILATKTLVCPDDDATMSLAERSLVSIPPVTSCEAVDIFILSAIWPSDVRRISWRRFAPETKSEKFNKHVCFAWFSSDLPLKQRNNLTWMSLLHNFLQICPWNKCDKYK